MSEDLNLKDLDQKALDIGIGGDSIPEKSKEDYQKRMQKRKEVQVKRLEKRNKEKGLIIVLTGNGKGKTTSALGMALRTLGHNHQVAIVQFIKGGWEPGEARALKVFGSKLKWHALGEGFTWETQDREKDKELINKSWDKAVNYLKNINYKLIILDEVIVAVKLGYISEESLISAIKKRPELTHVILTGRGATEKIIKEADLVTEMRLTKHPFREQGVKAQKGIEY